MRGLPWPNRGYGRFTKKIGKLVTKIAMSGLANESVRSASSDPLEIAPDELETLCAEIKLAHQQFNEALSTNNKDHIRALHLEAKKTGPGYDPELLRGRFKRRLKYFKSGSQIDVSKIDPQLYLVDSTLWEDLFAITRGCWSMPFNKGYGRRLRFVVFDNFHESVIGVIGLQSPPADLRSRDSLFAYPKGKKLDLVNNTLDAYTVGAIPPYSFLLGGKLCAGMISTDTVRRMYWRKYMSQRSLMSDQKIKEPLVAVTTTSAFGRSSIYNRLKYGERLLAEPIGYTEGFGTIHLEHLYSRMVNVLNANGRLTPSGFGNGPKVRWQNITKALSSLGIPREMLQHGLRREVFLFRLVDRLEEGMAGGSFGAPIRLEEAEFSNYWKERWAAPRAARYPEWSTIDAVDLILKKLNEV